MPEDLEDKNGFFEFKFVPYTCVTANRYNIGDGPNVDSKTIRRNLHASGEPGYRAL